MSGRIMRSWAALALAGAAAVILLAMVTIRTAGSGLAPYLGAPLLMSLDSPRQWAFTTEQTGLSGLQLWLAEPIPPEGTLTVSVLPANNPTVELAAVTIPLAAADAEGRVEARFEPIWVHDSPYVPTTTLVVRITTTDLAPDRQITIQGSTEGQGPAFTPLYQTRPFDMVWPISAMAAGRTGILGMPSFYALLAYSFLVALIRVLLVAVRTAALR